MKGFKFVATTLITSSVLMGCQSTTQPNDYTTMHYPSRCEHINQNAENTKASTLEYSVTPEIPYIAAKDKLSGYVRLEFDLSMQGEPININVIESYPNEIYNYTAKRALEKWQYKNTNVQCETVQIDFTFA